MNHENFPLKVETGYFEKSQIAQSQASEVRNTCTPVKYNNDEDELEEEMLSTEG